MLLTKENFDVRHRHNISVGDTIVCKGSYPYKFEWTKNHFIRGEEIIIIGYVKNDKYLFEIKEIECSLTDINYIIDKKSKRKKFLSFKRHGRILRRHYLEMQFIKWAPVGGL